MSVTVRIDRELDEWLNLMIKKRRFYNKTHALEWCIVYTKEHLEKEEPSNNKKG